MSYDLMVFDPEVPPPDRAGFMAWFGEQVQWNKGSDYNDPTNCSARLGAWFADMRRVFPPVNGPFADLSSDESKWADYSIGESFIYVCFSWAEAHNAHELAFHVARKHGVGLFNVSERDGEAWAPDRSGRFACIHGSGAAFRTNPEVYVTSISAVKVIKPKPE
jgi:hypothetical protein